MSGLINHLTGSKLLIHADPGARSGFIAAWLTNKLSALEFDSGAAFAPRYYKIHKLDNVSDLTTHVGLKIRVRPKLDSIDLHSLLFLRKNVYTQIPEFTHNEYSLDTFTKLTHFAQEIFEQDRALDYNLYDIILNFSDTFDTDFMVQLYKKVVGSMPTNAMIDILVKTNELNNIPIDKNHACSILKLCLTQELKQDLKEEHRFWSIVNTYNNTPVNELYDTVHGLIVPDNYGIML